MIPPLPLPASKELYSVEFQIQLKIYTNVIHRCEYRQFCNNFNRENVLRLIRLCTSVYMETIKYKTGKKTSNHNSYAGEIFSASREPAETRAHCKAYA